MEPKPYTEAHLNEAIEQWGEIAIDRFREALDHFEIGKLDGALWKSFSKELVMSNGNVERVIIKFLKYGRFVDMGSGRGVTAGSLKKLGQKVFSKNRKENGQLHRYNRRAKPFYSSTKTYELRILRLVMASKYGLIALGEVEKALSNRITINPSI